LNDATFDLTTWKGAEQMTYIRDLTKTEAFAEFGAILKNRLNEYSAPASDGSIVVECWSKYIKRLDHGSWLYHVHDFYALKN